MCLIIIISKVFPYNVSAYFDSWHFVTMYDMLFFVVLHLLPLNNNLKPMSEVLFSRVDFYLLLPRNPIHLGLQPSSQLKVTWTPLVRKIKIANMRQSQLFLRHLTILFPFLLWPLFFSVTRQIYVWVSEIRLPSLLSLPWEYTLRSHFNML